MRKTLFYGLLLMLMTACAEKSEKKQMHTLFVGTYTDGASKGIYKFTFDPETGTLLNQSLAATLPNPSYLKISKDKKNLYAVQETADFDSLGGGVSAFKLQDGLLEFQNSMGSGGAHPCHVSLSGDGHLAVCNYNGGNVSIFALTQEGALGTDPQIIDHKVLDTTKTAHAHMAQFTADGLFVTDLGLDAVKRYQNKEGQFVPADQASIAFANGTGPRHFTFGEGEKFLYVINELNSTVSVFEKDVDGDYQEIQTTSTLEPDFDGKSFCADIHLSPDGKFLYGSNRGENTIVIFSVDVDSGKLETKGRESVHGDWPRNFTLDPTGEFLLVANQKSDNIVIFKRDGISGGLEFLHETELPSPVCLEFLD
ncbi:MAG: lactonase family protein [Allomuricauda sp.]